MPPIAIGPGNGHGHRSCGPVLSLGTRPGKDLVTTSVTRDDSCHCTSEVQFPMCVQPLCMCPVAVEGTQQSLDTS